MFSIYCSTSSSLIWILNDLLITKASQSTGYLTSLQSPNGGILPPLSDSISPYFLITIILLFEYWKLYVLFKHLKHLISRLWLNGVLALPFVSVAKSFLHASDDHCCLQYSALIWESSLPYNSAFKLKRNLNYFHEMFSSTASLYLGSYINHSFKLNIVIGLYAYSERKLNIQMIFHWMTIHQFILM